MTLHITLAIIVLLIAVPVALTVIAMLMSSATVIISHRESTCAVPWIDVTRMHAIPAFSNAQAVILMTPLPPVTALMTGYVRPLLAQTANSVRMALLWHARMVVRAV